MCACILRLIIMFRLSQFTVYPPSVKIFVVGLEINMFSFSFVGVAILSSMTGYWVLSEFFFNMVHMKSRDKDKK